MSVLTTRSKPPRGSLALTLCSTLFSVWLALPAEALARPVLKVIDLLPGYADRKASTQQLERAANLPVRLDPPPAALVDALRWAAADPAREACLEATQTGLKAMARQKWVSPPNRPEELFPALLKQAEQQVLFLELQPALDSLQQARAVLPCTPLVASREQVRTLFALEAVAHLYLGDGQEGGSLQDLLAVDMEFRLGADYAAKAHKALEAARPKASRQMPRGLQAGTLSGALYVDGQPLAGLSGVRPGRHLLQARNGQGEVRGALVRVEAGQEALALDSLTDLGLPPGEPLVQGLGRGLSGGSLEGWQKQALNQYLATANQAALVMAFAQANQPQLALYRPVEGLGLGSRNWKPWAEEDGQGSVHESVVFLNIGGGMQVTPGMAFEASGLAIGYDLRVGTRLMPGSHLTVESAFSFAPHLLRADPSAAQCASPGAGGEPSLDDQSLAHCLEPRPLWRVGLGAGWLIDLPQGLQLRPSLLLEAISLPNTLQVTSSGTTVVNVLTAGLSPRGRLDWRLPMSGLASTLGLEVTAGVFPILADGLTLATPVTASLQAGASF